MSTRNIRLRLAYDGSGYFGWQVQPGTRTVQEVLEKAIRSLTGEDVRAMCAGRTDAGVHALGQVVSFPTSSTIPARKFAAALQPRLPGDVVVLESAEAAGDFHATYSAVSKRYRYVIRCAEVDDPFFARFAWRVGVSLDFAQMQSASQALLGTHDFRCFESQWPNKATSVRTVLEARWTRCDRWPAWSAEPLDVDGPNETANGEFLCFEIEADGFLYNMVRAIVGTLYDIGRGRWPADRMQTIIASQDRAHAGETAPARGLYLVRVNYEERKNPATAD
ncbi:MAG: tRNA pseudouridine(38-40) synthase TruA [Planctomycetota bacterium]|nr:MAG: tRNA pseudouridine(38-40) synthase TruA [Planctomycetota bacterium]REK26769.1 MAG: tRNA pseudouridine(38-40) synthase TruA [Planctomycetota bacterium]REK35730.1 MAG: tRNA pseudouridine(38-40) synthase TruA [Planctomycetota bacterium]